MEHGHRVLLVEHLDAIGAAPSDARLHATALRAAGCTVETIVLAGGHHDDLLFTPTGDAAGPGTRVLDERDGGRDALARHVRAARVDRIVWASATPGGGDAARALAGRIPAAWWPTGFAAAGAAAGPLAELDRALAPPAGSALDPRELAARTLPLWDGPFVLVPAPPGARACAALLAAFAHAVRDRAEVDLVVCAHPDARFEALARREGVGQRVHFVGPAQRGAEVAWLRSAALAVLTADAPLSGGLVLRALACGCPLAAGGEANAPLPRWLRSQRVTWADAAGDLAGTLSAGLARGDDVAAARERGRALARAHEPAALAERLARALGAVPAGRRAA